MTGISRCDTAFPWIFLKGQVSVVHLDGRPTGDQEVAGSIPTGSGNILQ